MRSPRTLGIAASATVLLTALLAPTVAHAAPGDVLPSRAPAPVILTGAQVPSWSQLPATGTPNPYPVGAVLGERSAHNGTIVVPPDVRTGVDPSKVAAYKWDAERARFVEVPVQVDQRFPYFLANPNSSFGVYSGTDTELTYQWDVESWKMTAGDCAKAYSEGESAMVDPVPGLDDDDEIVVMASDTGARAPNGELGPMGTDAGTRQEVAVVDPLRQSSSYVYLFLKDGGSKAPGYVSYQRDPDADQWIDRTFFAAGDPAALGISNTGYGPNLHGTVCPDGTAATAKASTDRFPRDGVTVRTSAYEWQATGRWMVRGMHVAKPDQPGVYGPDLIDRWKGRAFQSSPDSSISVVGFEDEQVNWEANSSLLGERVGPVRAIREVWGADSGTNVTKTETFYRDAVTYRYRLRVHPIPSDGLYTSWDYNAGVATKYYNALKPDGVDIDGVNDEAYGNVDSLPNGDPAFFDAPDATFDSPVALLKWEQVSGRDDFGSLVYVLENKGPTTMANPTVVPFYRDDACFDDGTGDDPVPRPWPGEPSFDSRVQQAYGDADCSKREKQGAFGEHGVHYFATWDTDNLFVGSPTPVDETDAQQWQFAVPTAAPAAIGEPYAQEVRVPLVAVGVSQANAPRQDATSIDVTGDRRGRVGEAATLRARLVDADADGAPLAGRSVRFDLQDRTWSATTGSDGVATITVDHLSGPAGASHLTVAFAGSDTYRPSSSAVAFDVDPAPAPDPGASSASSPAPAAPPHDAGVAAPSSTTASGYWMLGADGVVYAFGDAAHVGDAPSRSVAAVDIEPTPSNHGYWITDATGRVTAFGDAPSLGDAPVLPAGEAVTSLSATPSGGGYWLFTSRGRVVAFGDAPHLGDLSGTALNGPVLDSVPTPSGRGYYLVASDGGVFTFGDADFRGSMGSTRLNAPVQSLVPDRDGVGYWLVASDGGIFTFDAAFLGSMGDTRLNRPITGMVASTTGLGYLMVGEDGGIFTFGDVPFHGSLGADPPASGITSVAAVR